MKKKFLLLTTLLLLSLPVYAEMPPEKIVLHNVVNHETFFVVLRSYLSPTRDVDLYSLPDATSDVIGTLKKESYGKIVATEVHTYPYSYDTKPTAEQSNFYLLAKRGEGYYYIWEDNKVQEKNLGKAFKTTEQLWICVRQPDTNLEGWVKIDDHSTWRDSPSGTAFYFQDEDIE